MNWDDDISGPHLAIAGSGATRLGVLAGPGTGKTSYGLMRRVVRLLAGGTPGDRIMLVSFTRTAAHDLRDKVATLGVQGADDVRATTLHSYCFTLLRRASVLEITGRNPRPLMEHEADLMLRDMTGDFGDIRERRDLLKAWQAGWARGINDHPGLTELPVEREFEKQVLRWLVHHVAILIGEVVPLAYSYLKVSLAEGDYGDFDHIIVDEYQDLNFLEQELLGLIADNTNAALCVAGDDDQSIYGFRQANPVGIQHFLGREDVESHSIDVCGRCPRIVLSMANYLMAHAPDRDKAAVGCLHEETDGDVSIVRWDDQEAEIEGVVAAIASDLQAERRQPGDILVLAHRRKIGEAIRDRLRELDVSVHSFFNEEAVKTPEAQEALALLRVAVDDDPVSVRVIIGMGDSSGRADAYRRLQNLAASIGVTERMILDSALNDMKAAGKFRAFIPRYRHARSIIDGLAVGNLPAIIDTVLPEGAEELAELRTIAVELAPVSNDLADLVDGIVNRITQVDVPASPDYVRIMSLHKSKGLTSPSVFVVGLVHGIVPTLMSRLSEDETEVAVAEQRRLMYVALTRSAGQLVLSFAQSMELALANSMGVQVVKAKIRRTDGKFWAPTIASPYLAELGPDAPKTVSGAIWLKTYGS